MIQVFTLTVMSADRYLAVCRAIESRRYRTPCYSRAVCVAVWVASLLVMMPIYLYSRSDLGFNPSAYSNRVGKVGGGSEVRVGTAGSRGGAAPEASSQIYTNNLQLSNAFLRRFVAESVLHLPSTHPPPKNSSDLRESHYPTRPGHCGHVPTLGLRHWTRWTKSRSRSPRVQRVPDFQTILFKHTNFCLSLIHDLFENLRKWIPYTVSYAKPSPKISRETHKIHCITVQNFMFSVQ